MQKVSMKTVDFVTLLKNYTSGWVAISADLRKVVLSGKTLQEVTKKAKGIKEKLYIISRQPILW